MKYLKCILLFAALLGLCLVSSGCIGSLARSVNTSSKSYSQVATNVSSIPNEKARVWVFAIEGSPSVWHTMGSVGFVTFNRTVYRLGGHSFFYVDIPAGDYRVTTGEVLKPSLGTHPHFRSGKIQTQIALQSGNEYFMQVGGMNMPRYQLQESAETGLSLIEAPQASEAMKPLSHWKGFEIGMNYQFDE